MADDSVDNFLTKQQKNRGKRTTSRQKFELLSFEKKNNISKVFKHAFPSFIANFYVDFRALEFTHLMLIQLKFSLSC